MEVRELEIAKKAADRKIRKSEKKAKAATDADTTSPTEPAPNEVFFYNLFYILDHTF